MTDEYLTGPNGTYRLLQRIGAGGMGVVHLALDEDGRTIAVKELHPGLIDDDMLRRFEREVASMHQVSSPYVAEIRDADVRGERPFVATRYVQGRPLDKTVRERGPLEGAQLVHVAQHLATALQAVHDAGIIHRDLKPSNVMLSEGMPVIIDFGIAQAIDATRLTYTGMVVGTPGYVAPEIVNGGEAGQPADVFAWAATVAYAATGRSPFGTGPAEVVFFRVTGGQSDLHGVPEPLLPILRSALSRDPGARPTAAELADRLATVRLDPADPDPAVAAPSTPQPEMPGAPEVEVPGAVPGTGMPGAGTEMPDVRKPTPPEAGSAPETGSPGAAAATSGAAGPSEIGMPGAGAQGTVAANARGMGTAGAGEPGIAGTRGAGGPTPDAGAPGAGASRGAGTAGANDPDAQGAGMPGGGEAPAAGETGDMPATPATASTDEGATEPVHNGPPPDRLETGQSAAWPVTTPMPSGPQPPWPGQAPGGPPPARTAQWGGPGAQPETGPAAYAEPGQDQPGRPGAYGPSASQPGPAPAGYSGQAQPGQVGPYGPPVRRPGAAPAAHPGQPHGPAQGGPAQGQPGQGGPAQGPAQGQAAPSQSGPQLPAQAQPGWPQPGPGQSGQPQSGQAQSGYGPPGPGLSAGQGVPPLPAGQPGATLPAGSATSRDLQGSGVPRLGFGLGVLVVVGASALTYVLPFLGILIAIAALLMLGMRDRIRPHGTQPTGPALLAAGWRTAAAFAGAGIVAWLVEAIFELIAKPMVTGGKWTGLAAVPATTILAAFVALTVLLACAVPRWHAPPRALAALVTGVPALRYVLIAVAVLAIIAALFTPAPAWFPLPIGHSATFGDVLT